MRQDCASDAPDKPGLCIRYSRTHAPCAGLHARWCLSLSSPCAAVCFCVEGCRLVAKASQASVSDFTCQGNRPPHSHTSLSLRCFLSASLCQSSKPDGMESEQTSTWGNRGCLQENLCQWSRLNAKVRQRRRGQSRDLYACETGSSLTAMLRAPSIYGRCLRLEVY